MYIQLKQFKVWYSKIQSEQQVDMDKDRLLR